MGEDLVGDRLDRQERHDGQIGRRRREARCGSPRARALPSSTSPDHSTSDMTPRCPTSSGGIHGHVGRAAQEARPEQLVGRRRRHRPGARARDLARVRRADGTSRGRAARTISWQRELELGHDAEVAAAAAQRPEQVRVLALATRARSRRRRSRPRADSRLSIVSPSGASAARRRRRASARPRRCATRRPPGRPARAPASRGRRRPAARRRRQWRAARLGSTCDGVQRAQVDRRCPSSQTLWPGIE